MEKILWEFFNAHFQSYTRFTDKDFNQGKIQRSQAYFFQEFLLKT